MTDPKEPKRLTRRQLRKIALDYAAGILENAIGCDYPDEISDRDGAAFEREIQRLADQLSNRLERYK